MDNNPTESVTMEIETHKQDTIAKPKEADTVDNDTQLLKKQGLEKTVSTAGDIHNGEC